MPYKNPQQKVEYQREYMQRRRAGLRPKTKYENEMGSGFVGQVAANKLLRERKVQFQERHIILLDGYAKRNEVDFSSAVATYIQKGLAHDVILKLKESTSLN